MHGLRSLEGIFVWRSYINNNVDAFHRKSEQLDFNARNANIVDLCQGVPVTESVKASETVGSRAILNSALWLSVAEH